MPSDKKYTVLRIFLKYLHYYINSNNAHGVHSPFVFSLYRNIIRNEWPNSDFREIEMIRQSLRVAKENHPCEFASKNQNGLNSRSISNLAIKSGIKPRYGSLLYRLISYFKPDLILEIGTSLGLSSMYIGKANSFVQFITLEGCKQCAEMAEQNFRNAKLDSVEVISGEFSSTLPIALNRLGKLDFAFIDGNHKKTAVIEYYEQILPFVHTETMLIFDDIHWSGGMEEAWELIRNDCRVKVTIDLFFLGIVFFKDNQAKENFILRF